MEIAVTTLQPVFFMMFKRFIQSLLMVVSISFNCGYNLLTTAYNLIITYNL